MFDYAWDFLVAALGPSGPLIVLGAMGLILILISAPLALRKKKDPFKKLNEVAAIKGQDKSNESASKDASQGLKLRAENRNSGLEALAPYLEPQDQAEFSTMRLKLTRAGYRTRSAVATFHLVKVCLGLGGLALGVILLLLNGAEGSLMRTMYTVLVPGVIGYFAPSYWVTRRVQGRQEEIIDAFPDSLDLMLVCVEAGQSLDQAIDRVAKEIRAGYPVLADEFEIVATEVRAGKDRVSVLRDMAERCDVADISSFVTVLIQSATFGTSIASALRVYASEMRDKRVMRAEEKANKLPTKLTLGTMLFTVPALLVVLVGPSLYDIYTTLYK